MIEIDIVLVVIGVVTMILAGATFFVAVLTLRASNRDVRASEKTLELAREEAKRYPKLEITDAFLKDANESEVVIQTREAKKAWPKALEEFKKPPSEKRQSTLEEDLNSYTVGQARYKGPFPDFILEFRLHNKSSEVVGKLSGDVRFESEFLEPVDFPLLEQGAIDSETMRLSVDTLPPAHSGEARVFKIALLKRKSGQTTATATFSNQVGYYLKEHIPLDVF